ncbi:hypothetical protein A3F66_06635 [candidate division TM6 bacterium RIFCSPHIGHO2_12_FULL_32_22]|nr:MAG: hypothetical protein A3F66_06635 [candidate division TM6 bacterium RIFCSPHIGHO2_12_FULL_32_22]
MFKVIYAIFLLFFGLKPQEINFLEFNFPSESETVPEITKFNEDALYLTDWRKAFKESFEDEIIRVKLNDLNYSMNVGIVLLALVQTSEDRFEGKCFGSFSLLNSTFPTNDIREVQLALDWHPKQCWNWGVPSVKFRCKRKLLKYLYVQRGGDSFWWGRPDFYWEKKYFARIPEPLLDNKLNVTIEIEGDNQ